MNVQRDVAHKLIHVVHNSYSFFGVKVPGYPQADSVIKHAWKEIFAGIKHLWGGMNVAVSNF